MLVAAVLLQYKAMLDWYGVVLLYVVYLIVDFVSSILHGGFVLLGLGSWILDFRRGLDLFLISDVVS